MTKSVFRVLGFVASLVGVGAASAADAPAVQWKVSDGGNGHWYALISATGAITWNQAKASCEQLGGYLATVPTAPEDAFVHTVVGQTEAYLGGFQSPGSCEPGCGWQWLTGEPWGYTNWDVNLYEPNNNNGGQDFMRSYPGGQWDDVWGNVAINFGIAIEWSADCNDDGVVDYGQILSGELADTNNNGVLDVCELVITSVQPISGPSTGGTAVRINGNNFPNPPVVTIGGVAATDIVRVTPSLITAVTPAGTPGMAVVAVNGASSESFYYRPSCDGDLDNNGTIDSSDLGLMLVNYGNCYESAVPEPQQQEPFILQSVETVIPLLLNKK